MNEVYGEDYYTAPDSKVVALVEQISAWKNQNLTLYPNDIFNMLIDHNLINQCDLEIIMKRIKDTKTTPKLPTSNMI